jgi:hypothetical protein
MPSQLRAYQATVFQALAHPTRIAIVETSARASCPPAPSRPTSASSGPTAGFYGFGSNSGLAIDAAGNLYISEPGLIVHA